MENWELSKLYEQYGYYVRRRCLALLHNSVDADDACQEVFLRVHKYHRTRTGGTWLGWLYTIALRCCFDLARQRAREQPASDEALAAAELRHESVDPDRRAVLGAALRQLDVKTCEIGVLHYLDGFSQQEVGEQTGYSRRTVVTKLRNFEEHLRRYGFERGPSHE